MRPCTPSNQVGPGCRFVKVGFEFRYLPCNSWPSRIGASILPERGRAHFEAILLRLVDRAKQIDDAVEQSCDLAQRAWAIEQMRDSAK